MSIPLHVYVIHAKFLGVRKPIIDTLFEKLTESKQFELTTEFVTEYDPQELAGTDVRQHIDLTKSQKPNDVFDALIKNMHVKQLSNAIKHKTAIQRIAENKKFKGISLVIEDDIVYGDDVAKKLANLLEKLQDRKSDWDLCFLGLPQPVNATPTDIIRPTTDTFKIIPSIESYILHQASAEKLTKLFHPIKFNANVHFSYLVSRNPTLKVMMSTSNVFIDGTKFGVYLSTLEPNSKLFLNTDYNRLSQIVLKDTLTEEDVKSAEEILGTIKFKNHPDILTLQGILKEKQGDYTEAKNLLDTAYTTFMNNECIINNESEFMIHYTRIFRYTQTE